MKFCLGPQVTSGSHKNKWKAIWPTTTGTPFPRSMLREAYMHSSNQTWKLVAKPGTSQTGNPSVPLVALVPIVTTTPMVVVWLDCSTSEKRLYRVNLLPGFSVSEREARRDVSYILISDWDPSHSCGLVPSPQSWSFFGCIRQAVWSLTCYILYPVAMHKMAAVDTVYTL